MSQKIFRVALLMLVCLAGSAALKAGSWKAGAARAKITPAQSMWLAGYASRSKPAEGTLTDLWAKALVLEDAEGHRVVLISLDLVGIGRAIPQAVCGELEKNFHLARSQVLLACSHTHSGPVIKDNLRPMHYERVDARGRQLIDQYCKGLEQQIVAVVGEATRSLEPSEVFWGSGRATFAVNRRNNPEPAVVKLRADGRLQGPVDHDVPVLAVKNRGGGLTAVVFGYACHATVLNGNQWCADYPGYAQTGLEAAHPGCTALFVAGCGGDQNPLPRRSVELAQHYGGELSTAVETVLAGSMAPLSGRIEAVYREIELPFESLPSKGQLESDARDSNVYTASRARLLLADLEKAGKLPSSYPYPVQAWRLGPLGLVALGGEVVVDYSLRLKQELAAEKLWVAAYANDVMAYVPSRRVLAEGGYEGGDAMVYYGLPSPWSPDVEERIVRAVRDELREIQAKDN